MSVRKRSPQWEALLKKFKNLFLFIVILTSVAFLPYLLNLKDLKIHSVSAAGCGIFIPPGGEQLAVYGVDTGDASTWMRVNAPVEGVIEYRWGIVRGSGTISPQTGSERVTYTTGLPNNKHSDEVEIEARVSYNNGSSVDCRALIFVTRKDPPVCRLRGGWPESGNYVEPGGTARIVAGIFEGNSVFRSGWDVATYTWSGRNRFRGFDSTYYYGGPLIGAINPTSGSGTTLYRAPSEESLRGTGFVEAVEDIYLHIIDTRGLENDCDTYVHVRESRRPRSPSSCSVGGPDFLFLSQRGDYQADVTGGDSPFNYSWSKNPDVGRFRDQTGSRITYEAPDEVPPRGEVTLTATVSNAGGSVSCSKTVKIYEGIIQGRVFSDENENGRKDSGESFVTENIGNISIIPNRNRQDPPEDGCVGQAFGYRYRKVPPNVNHTVSFNLTASGWRVTGAYYTLGGLSCNRSGAGAVGRKVSNNEYRVDNVTVWDESPTTNLWFGAKRIPPPVCQGVSGVDSLFTDKSSVYEALASGESPLSYSWSKNPDLGSFSNQSGNRITYTAPGSAPEGEIDILISAVVGNPGGSVTCTRRIRVYEGVIQGRIFGDKNENGFKDSGEEFITEDIGTVTLEPSRTRSDPPSEGCPGNAQGYKYKAVEPGVNHRLTLRVSSPGWKVTGAYYTNGGSACDSSGFAASWVKVSGTELRVDNVTVWSGSPTTNLWLGVKYPPPSCTGITADPDSLLVGGSSQLNANVSGPGLTYSWSVSPEVGSFDDAGKANPVYRAPLTAPPLEKVVVSLTVSNLAGSASCPSLELPVKERVIQGRFFLDDGGPSKRGVGGNGVKDGDEEFVEPPPGTLAIVKKGSQPLGTNVLGTVLDACGPQRGFRSSNNLPAGTDYAVLVDLQGTAPEWRFTGAYYTQSQAVYCTNLSQCSDPLCGDDGLIEHNGRGYLVSGIDLSHTVVNLWFGLKRLICDNSAPSAISPASSCEPPGMISYTWSSHADTRDFWVQVDDTNGATNLDGSFVSTVPGHNQWLGSNVAAYSFDGSAYRGQNIFFHVKSRNSCDQESPWSETSKVLVDSSPVILNLSLFPPSPAPGTTEIDVTVDFETASAGSVTLDYEINGTPSGSPYTEPFTYNGIDTVYSRTHTFAGLSLNVGDVVTAKAEVRADNSPTGPDCGLATRSVSSGGVTLKAWMQVVNGDVYSNYQIDSALPGISLYVNKDFSKPYFLVSTPGGEQGGVILAFLGAECRDCLGSAALNEKTWRIEDYQTGIDWPGSILDKVTASDSAERIKIVYEGGDFDIEPGNATPADPTLYIVGGDVTIKDSVTRVEAMIISGGKIRVEDTGSHNKLEVRGALYAKRGFDFTLREFGNNSEPAIVVEYDPRFVLSGHQKLDSAKYSWVEEK